MESYNLLATLQLIVRWMHVFAVILWIGQTYLFNFLEKNLEPSDEPEVLGKLWMVHGGGLYRVEKQRFADFMPATLHWFKWEAAGTWLTGATLIALAYYVDGLLIEPGMDYTVAAGAGIGAILLGWFVYDGLVRSPLGKSPRLFAVVGLGLILALHYGFLQVMSSRAAFIHVGAVLGTIMAANVWVRILPAQTRMLAFIGTGERPDPGLSATGPMRSRHNSYTVIAVVAVMIGNHYPSISYGSDFSTIILGAMILVGWGVARLFRGPTK
jgi:uncharacterized membrane protein